MVTDEPRSPPQSPQRRTVAFLRQFALAMELPFIPILAVLIGGGIGYWLDTRLHTSPWLLLVFGALGFVAGIREILHRVARQEKRNGSG